MIGHDILPDSPTFIYLIVSVNIVAVEHGSPYPRADTLALCCHEIRITASLPSVVHRTSFHQLYVFPPGNH